MHSHVLWLHHVMKKVLVDMLYDFLPIMLDSADSCQNMAIYSWWWLMLMDFGYFCYVSFSTAMLALEHLNQKKDHMIFLTFCQNKVLSWPSWIIGVMDKRSNAHPELPLAPLPPSYSFRPAAMLLGPCFFFFFCISYPYQLLATVAYTIHIFMHSSSSRMYCFHRFFLPG